MLSEYSPGQMQNLVERWSYVTENNINPSQCTQLIDDTNKIGSYLEHPVNSQASDEKIIELRHALLTGFGKLNKPELFTNWFDNSNENDEKSRVELKEACKSLHHLFDGIAANNTPDSSESLDEDSNFMHGLEVLADIDMKAMSYIDGADANPEINFLNAPKDLQKFPKEVLFRMYSNLDIPGLLAIRLTSIESRAIVNQLLIDKINSGRISFSDFGIASDQDLIKIFGIDDASKIDFFELQEQEEGEERTETKIICLAQLNLEDLLVFKATPQNSHALTAHVDSNINHLIAKKLNSGEISFIDLNIVTKDEMAAFFGESSSEIIYLEVMKDQVEILSVGQLKNITELKLPAYYELESPLPQDISALKYCSELVTLVMSFNSNADIGVLRSCPLIENLDIEYSDIADISILSNLQNLKYLAISSTQVTDVSVLNNLPNLKKIYCTNCKIKEYDLKVLSDRKVEIS